MRVRRQAYGAGMVTYTRIDFECLCGKIWRTKFKPVSGEMWSVTVSHAGEEVTQWVINTESDPSHVAWTLMNGYNAIMGGPKYKDSCAFLPALRYPKIGKF